MQCEMFPEDVGKVAVTQLKLYEDFELDIYRVSDSGLNQFVTEIISIMWSEVCEMIAERISSPRLSDEFMADYYATIGWLLGYWRGAIPLDAVLLFENNDQKNPYDGPSYKNILDILSSHPTTKSDCVDFKNKMCGLGADMLSFNTGVQND